VPGAVFARPRTPDTAPPSTHGALRRVRHPARASQRTCCESAGQCRAFVRYRTDARQDSGRAKMLRRCPGTGAKRHDKEIALIAALAMACSHGLSCVPAPVRGHIRAMLSTRRHALVVIRRTRAMALLEVYTRFAQDVQEIAVAAIERWTVWSPSWLRDEGLSKRPERRLAVRCVAPLEGSACYGNGYGEARRTVFRPAPNANMTSDVPPSSPRARYVIHAPPLMPVTPSRVCRASYEGGRKFWGVRMPRRRRQSGKAR